MARYRNREWVEAVDRYIPGPRNVYDLRELIATDGDVFYESVRKTKDEMDYLLRTFDGYYINLKPHLYYDSSEWCRMTHGFFYYVSYNKILESVRYNYRQSMFNFLGIGTRKTLNRLSHRYMSTNNIISYILYTVLIIERCTGLISYFRKKSRRLERHIKWKRVCMILKLTDLYDDTGLNYGIKTDTYFTHNNIYNIYFDLPGMHTVIFNVLQNRFKTEERHKKYKNYNGYTSDVTYTGNLKKIEQSIYRFGDISKY